MFPKSNDMKKLEILVHKKESVEKAKMDIEQTEEDFELGLAYIDLKEVQSINRANDSWNDREIFFLYLTAASYTVVGSIDRLAEEIEKVKSRYILGVN